MRILTTTILALVLIVSLFAMGCATEAPDKEPVPTGPDDKVEPSPDAQEYSEGTTAEQGTEEEVEDLEQDIDELENINTELDSELESLDEDLDFEI